jgi:tripartite-type tricarboxylate transporter receptor subunit TctC
MLILSIFSRRAQNMHALSVPRRLGIPARLSLVAAGLAATAALAAETRTADGAYPVKPIRIISPVSSGGSNDAIARTVGEILADNLGQQAVIDNRPGANGIIGIELVVRSTPDGYTLLLSSGANVAINPAVYGDKLPFNITRDLVPITQVAAQSFIAHVAPAFQVKSIAELIALAKAKPGAVNFASAGTGSTAHMLVALFSVMTATQFTHVPYKGAPQGRVAVMARECDFMFDGLLATLPLIKAGRLRGLGVTGSKRSPVAPDIPTIAEAGVPGYSGDAWYALFAPRGTPRPVVARLNTVIVQALQQPERRDRLIAQGAEGVGSSPEAFAAFLDSETKKWARVVRDAGIKPD